MVLPRDSSLPVLIVDDELAAIEGVRFLLETGGVTNIISSQDSRSVMELLVEQKVGIVLLDLSMPHVSGRELLSLIKEEHPEIPVIIVTGANDVDTAVECMQNGAFDYMVKPVEEQRMISGVKRAIEMRELKREYCSFKVRVLSNTLEHPEAFSKIVTQNAAMRSLFQYVETIAKTDRPVLITGETGVGKELVSQAIHEVSGRKGPFVTVNAAGLDDNLFSDTLFGHSKGAFTGADRTRDGLISKAMNGTLFLDEIGDLTMESQIKLLRLLQEREYLPLGADVAKVSDARIIAATNRDLSLIQRERKFRADLYYRLQAHQIHIPPLRERLDDLPILVDHFLKTASMAMGKKKPTPPKELFTLLATYHFPGNVRSLESMVFDAISRHKSKILSMQSFKDHIERTMEPIDYHPILPPKGASPFGLFEELPTLKKAQQLLVEEAMRRADGNQTIASGLLGITPSGLNKALKRSRT